MKEGDLSSFKEASKQAEKEIPVRWYENRNVVNGVALGVTLLALWHRISTSGAPSAPSGAFDKFFPINNFRSGRLF